MSLETTTYIDGLVATNPTAGDPKSQGDDHLRLIKSAIKATFPNLNGAVTADPAELNKLDGMTATQAQLNRLAGSNSLVVDRAYAEYAANTDLTSVIPADDTIPQNTEGTQILSAAITPKSTTTRLRVRVQGAGALTGSNAAFTFAAFVNSTADALAASLSGNNAIANLSVGNTLEFEYVPGTTTTQTISIRVGPTSGTLRLNGTASARRFGGVSRATLVIEELAV